MPQTLLIATILVTAPSSILNAQRCSGGPFFEFQVDVPATVQTDTDVLVRPVISHSLRPANLVQFIVDTTGRVEARTFRPLRVADSALVRDAYDASAEWRFRPATLAGCRVRQLLEAEIRSQSPARRPSDER